MTSEEEGRNSIQRILTQINPPNVPHVPSPPTAYVAPGRRVQCAVMSGCAVEPFVNVSHHADIAPAVRPTCSSDQSSFTANEPISDAVSRPRGGNHQSKFSPNARSSEEIYQGGFPINAPASTSVARPSDDNLIPRNIPVPPIVAKSISAPSRLDIIRVPTITMRDRYPVIFPSSSNHGTVATSSGKPQLATAVDGEAVTNVTLQEHDVPTPSPVSSAETPGPNMHNNTGEGAFGSSTNALHTEPESLLAYYHLP